MNISHTSKRQVFPHALRIALVCLLTPLLFISCSLRGGTQTVLTKSSDDMADANAFTLRWFPVQAAETYRLYVESSDGKLLHQADVTPTGCTHPSREGYLSGVCSLAYSLPDTEKPFVLRLTAVNGVGKESKAAREVYPAAK